MIVVFYCLPLFDYSDKKIKFWVRRRDVSFIKKRYDILFYKISFLNDRRVQFVCRSPKDSLFTAKKRLRGFCDFHSIAIVVYIRFVFFVNYTYSIKKIIY